MRIVHDPHGSTETRRPSFDVDNKHHFRVAWDGGSYPKIDTCAEKGCTVSGRTCLCDVVVTIDPALNMSSVTAAEVKEACHIGHLCPAEYPPGTYALLSSGAEVDVYKASSGGCVLCIDAEAVFLLKASGTCFSNRLSTVHVGGALGSGSGSSFRNAPHFVSLATPTAADAAAETEAVLNHLFRHPNTAPFVAHRLIQRFTTSNPSPRYVSVVAAAFRTGTYGSHTYSGDYGDLAATIAAVLSDREATATTLDADPAHGVLREPLLQVHHVLRALEFTSRDGREIEMPDIKQAPAWLIGLLHRVAARGCCIGLLHGLLHGVEAWLC